MPRCTLRANANADTDTSLLAVIRNRVLKPWDVITAIDGVPLAHDGTIFFRKGERVLFLCALSLRRFMSNLRDCALAAADT